MHIYKNYETNYEPIFNKVKDLITPPMTLIRTKSAPKASLRPLFYFGKQLETVIACKKFF